MSQEKKFRTKSGYCHLLPDKLVLTREGVIGDLSKVVVGSNIARILILYGLVSMSLIFESYQTYRNHNLIGSFFLAILALMFLVGIFTSLNNSGTPVIERSSIQQVKFNKGIPGLTRQRFIVYFRNEQGKTKKRAIMLPGTLSGAGDENKQAVDLMKAEGLLN